MEHSPRSPMASRRIRRHAMGVSNANVDPDGSSCSPRGTVSLIHADRLVKVPAQDRPSDPAARETRVEDRPALNRVHDKLFKTFREPFVHKVLRSHCPDGSGLLSPGQLGAALERLHLGLDERERGRLVARVAPGQDGRVHYLDFLRSLEVPAPLGGEAAALARGCSVPGPPTVRPGGGGHGVGDGGRGSYWEWRRHPQQPVPGLSESVCEGTPEQAASEAALTSLLAARLRASQPTKLRDVFRRMDADRNSVIDREEFAAGVASLGVPASRAQLDRLFDLVDADGDGVIDYGEWAARFEERGGREPPAQQYKAPTLHPAARSPRNTTATTTASATASAGPAPSPDDVSGALAHPLIRELARGLYGRGGGAVALFQRLDATRSGRLPVAELTRCCQALVPGIQEQHIAAVAAALEPYSPAATSSLPATTSATSSATPGAAAAACGHVDYRSFLAGLLEAGTAHPRLLHSAPPGGRGGGGGEAGALGASGAGFGGGGGGTLSLGVGMAGTLARFGEPSSVPPPPVGPHTRSLSAVALSHSAAAAAVGDASATSASTPPALSAVPPDRSAQYELHEVAIGPFLESLDRSAAAAAGGATDGDAAAGGGGGFAASLPAVSRSVDMGTLGRTQRRMRQVKEQRGEAARSASLVPSHVSGRFSRFWTQRHADTNHVTVAHPASAAAPPAEGVWVRKDANDAYLAFQGVDREHRDRRRAQLEFRHAHRAAIDSRYSAQDDASGADEGRLAHKRALKQRYEERAEMYDRIRQGDADKAATCFFTRPPAFHEHQLEGSNTPTRAYW